MVWHLEKPDSRRLDAGGGGQSRVMNTFGELVARRRVADWIALVIGICL